MKQTCHFEEKVKKGGSDYFSKRYRGKRIVTWLSFLFLLAGCDLLRQGSRAEEKLEVWFVDVGHGDASVIVNSQREAVLVDAGQSTTAIIDFLSKLAIRSIHTAVISHASPEHYGALPAVLDRYAVGRVVLPAHANQEETWDNLLATLDARKIPSDTVYFGDTLCLGASAYLKVLWPLRSSEFMANNRSGVFQLHYGQSRILYAGDIAEPAEYEIQRLGADLSSQVLKVPNHGSGNSGSLPFLARVTPKWAVISCDSSRTPYPETSTLTGLAEVMAADGGLLRTDQLGDILFLVYPNRLSLSFP